MSAQRSTSSDTSPLPRAQAAELSRVYQEGLVAGLIGAATIAIWFFILDLFTLRPLYTPTVLGTALFRQGEGLASSESLQASLELVLMFTFVHCLVFIILGVVASRLLILAEGNPNLGFGIILFFVVFMFGFLVMAMLFAEPVLRALTWPAILIGNLLAAGVMGAFFWKRHPNLTIWP